MNCFRFLLAALFVHLGASASAHGQEPWQEPREIWFNQPSEEWKLGLPVGNGRLGAMVQGIYPKERIQLNEDTIWAREPMMRHPETTRYRVAEAQELVEAGKYREAHDLYATEIIMADAPQIGSYQTMGDLWIEHIGDVEPADDGYRRSLDIATGLVTITQPLSDGSVITQETVSSAVDDCIAIRITTTAEGGLDFDLSMTHPARSIRPVATADDTLLFEGQAQYPRAADRYLGTKFSTLVKVLPDSGTVTAGDEDGVLHVREAGGVTLLLTCATDYNPDQPQQPLPDGWQKQAAEILAKAEEKPWEKIKQDSMDDVASLMHRCDIDLGESAPELRALPNDERLERFDGTASDPELMEKYFQFGRYLLVSSSRPGTRPANLQGIWAHQLRNPWQSDYHLNINMQMNYWPAFTTGLIECHEPIFWLLDMLREEGRKMAQAYGAEGFCTPHALNLWGRCISKAREPRWSGSLISAPWQAMDIMEHHRYSGDTDMLRERGWPILRETCEFVRSWLIRDAETGKWVPRAAASHEIGFHYLDEDGEEQFSEIGPVTAYEQSITWQIMTDTLEAAAILGIEEEEEAFLTDIRNTLEELEYPRIGKDGDILEWGIEIEREADPEHRHLSHLVGFHPGLQISPRKTPELAEATHKSLVNRGIKGAGWAMAWRSAMYARFGDGETALKALDQLAARPSPNFFGDHRCQLDQNFGLTNAIAEILVQSHDGAVDLLPARPESWATGSARGFTVRGGFVVDMEWRDGGLVRAVIHSRLGGPLTIRYGDHEETHATEAGESVEFMP